MRIQRHRKHCMCPAETIPAEAEPVVEENLRPSPSKTRRQNLIIQDIEPVSRRNRPRFEPSPVDELIEANGRFKSVHGLRQQSSRCRCLPRSSGRRDAGTRRCPPKPSKVTVRRTVEKSRLNNPPLSRKRLSWFERLRKDCSSSSSSNSAIPLAASSPGASWTKIRCRIWKTC